MTDADLHHPLTGIQPGESSKLAAVILQLVPVQAIFLLGAATTCTQTTTIFRSGLAAASAAGHYYLLILVEKDEGNTLNAVQDKIENNLQHLVPATAIVLSTGKFITWLSKGHPFAVNVLAKAERLYQNEQLLFPSTFGTISVEEQKEANEQRLKQSKIRIDGFLASAELHQLRRDYTLSAFMLHQATEQALGAMLVVTTGLKLNTHSICKLLRYCAMFCHHLAALFPQNNEKEKKLLAQLNKAYISTRYKDDYTISCEELSCLMEKVKRVKKLLENNDVTLV